MSQSGVSKRDYLIREFRDADREEYLDLHSQIFGLDHGVEWFKWKYENNPYIDHIPIIVAENNGKLVGTRCHLALEMSIRGNRHLALQPADTMVDPTHQRQGLFTRMTEAAIDKYSDASPAFFFNFPNQQAYIGNMKLGWERVGEQSTCYRVQRPLALGLQLLDLRAPDTSYFSNPALTGHKWLSNVRLNSENEVIVRKHETIPSTTLATLASDQPASGIHVYRDKQFYEWRFNNPTWTYDTYLAECAGEAIAGMIVGTSTVSGHTVTKLTDIIPLPDSLSTVGLETLLSRIVQEYAHSDLLAAPAILPRSAARKAGFLSDDQLPLSYIANQTVHVVRSLTGEWNFHELDISNQMNWRLTFSEQDTS